MLDSDSFDSFLPWKFSNFGDSDWVDQGNRAQRAGVYHDDTVPPFMTLLLLSVAFSVY